MKISPKQSEEAYKNQNKFGRPPPGTYHMVGKALQKSLVGEKQTPKLTIKCHILKAVDGGDDAAAQVGKTFYFDLWWNLEKKGNIDKAGIVALAMGNEEEFDTNNDADLVRVYTGHAFQVRLEERENEWNGKTTKQIEVVECTKLSVETRKKYAAQPDWKSIIGDPKNRIEEEKTANSKPSAKKAKEADPFGSDDVPF